MMRDAGIFCDIFSRRGILFMIEKAKYPKSVFMFAALAMQNTYDLYLVMFSLQLPLRGLSVENKLLDGMTRRKIRDRVNRKFFTGFRDMAEFFKGYQDPIPPWWAPLIHRRRGRGALGGGSPLS